MLLHILLLASISNDIIEFNRWQIKYNKTIPEDGNITNQFNNWYDNRKLVDLHNLRNKDYKLELNEFADRGNDWATRDGHNVHLKNKEFNPPIEKDMISNLPNSIDWREKNVVTGVKNQQQCGSCWAFSAVGSIEGQHAKQSGKLVSLSESQIVDCDVNGSDAGCGGGLMDNAFKYVVKQGGIESEKVYPYVPEDEPCRFNRTKISAKITGYTDVEGGGSRIERSGSISWSYFSRN